MGKLQIKMEVNGVNANKQWSIRWNSKKEYMFYKQQSD